MRDSLRIVRAPLTRRRAAIGVVLAAGICVVLGVSLTRPVRLVAGKADTVIVNNWKPVPLAVRGVDVRGHERPVRGLHFQWVGGDQFPISDDGRITCTRSGDAWVDVSAGRLSTRFRLLCRPIKALHVSAMIQLIAGGAPQQLGIVGVGLDDHDVSTLVGSVTVEDERVAHLDGTVVYPESPGGTTVGVDVGDVHSWTSIMVNARTLDSRGMGPSQVFVAGPLKLEPGEVRTWPLSPGTYDIELVPGSTEPGGLVLTGHALNCMPTPRAVQDYWCVALPGAEVVVGNPRAAGPSSEGGASLYVVRPYDSYRDTTQVETVRAPTNRRKSSLY